MLYVCFCVAGEKDTLTHGSVVNGRFEGFIKTHQGTYYVEPSERYIKDKNLPFHSVIYHEDDIRKYLPLYLLYYLLKIRLKRFVKEENFTFAIWGLELWCIGIVK